MTGEPTGDDLRDRMRRADPAASLRPLPEEEARRLVAGAVLAHPLERKVFEHTRGPLMRRPVLVGAAAAIAVAAGVVVWTAGGSGQQPDPGVAMPSSAQPGPGMGTGTPDPGGNGGRPTLSGRPQPGTSTPPVTPPAVSTSPSDGRKTTVAVLTDGEQDPDVRCRKPEAAVLAAEAHMAFEATVLRIEGNVVTLQVHRAWTGEADFVEVRNTGNSPVLAGFDPEVGRRYLVAAADLRVMGCGYSGLDEPSLRAVYDEAFPGR